MAPFCLVSECDAASNHVANPKHWSMEDNDLLN
jgi:hypothetical protein